MKRPGLKNSCVLVCVLPVQTVAILVTDGESKFGQIHHCVHQPLLTPHHPDMLSFKSEPSDSLTSLTSSYSTPQELKNWERLVFTFDMDREPPPNSRNIHRSRSSSSANNRTGPPAIGSRTSEYNALTLRVHTPTTAVPSDVQDNALLGQFAAAAAGDVDEAYPNMMHDSYPSLDPAPGIYGNFLHHRSMPTPQLPPLSTPDFPWHSLPPHQAQAGPSHYASNPAASRTSAQPFLGVPFPPTVPATTNRWGQQIQGQQIQPVASSHNASSPEIEQTEAERSDITDEKRRRNTAASGESSVVI